MAVVKMSFVDLRTTEANIMTLNPPTISDGSTPDVVSTQIPGASHPNVGIGAGGSRLISFTLRIARTNENEKLTYVKDQVAWFRAVVSPYPIAAFAANDWTPLQFKWGSLYDLPVVLKSFKANFLHFRGEDALPEFADAEFSLEEIAYESITSPEVRTEGKGFIRYLQ